MDQHILMHTLILLIVNIPSSIQTQLLIINATKSILCDYFGYEVKFYCRFCNNFWNVNDTRITCYYYHKFIKKFIFIRKNILNYNYTFNPKPVECFCFVNNFTQRFILPKKINKLVIQKLSNHIKCVIDIDVFVIYKWSCLFNSIYIDLNRKSQLQDSFDDYIFRNLVVEDYVLYIEYKYLNKQIKCLCKLSIENNEEASVEFNLPLKSNLKPEIQQIEFKKVYKCNVNDNFKYFIYEFKCFIKDILFTNSTELQLISRHKYLYLIFSRPTNIIISCICFINWQNKNMEIFSDSVQIDLSYNVLLKQYNRLDAIAYTLFECPLKLGVNYYKYTDFYCVIGSETLELGQNLDIETIDTLILNVVNQVHIYRNTALFYYAENYINSSMCKCKNYYYSKSFDYSTFEFMLPYAGPLKTSVIIGNDVINITYYQSEWIDQHYPLLWSCYVKSKNEQITLMINNTSKFVDIINYFNNILFIYKLYSEKHCFVCVGNTYTSLPSVQIKDLLITTGEVKLPQFNVSFDCLTIKSDRTLINCSYFVERYQDFVNTDEFDFRFEFEHRGFFYDISKTNNFYPELIVYIYQTAVLSFKENYFWLSFKLTTNKDIIVKISIICHYEVIKDLFVHISPTITDGYFKLKYLDSSLLIITARTNFPFDTSQTVIYCLFNRTKIFLPATNIPDTVGDQYKLVIKNIIIIKEYSPGAILINFIYVYLNYSIHCFADPRFNAFAVKQFALPRKVLTEFAISNMIIFPNLEVECGVYSRSKIVDGVIYRFKYFIYDDWHYFDVNTTDYTRSYIIKHTTIKHNKLSITEISIERLELACEIWYGILIKTLNFLYIYDRTRSTDIQINPFPIEYNKAYECLFINVSFNIRHIILECHFQSGVTYFNSNVNSSELSIIDKMIVSNFDMYREYFSMNGYYFKYYMTPKCKCWDFNTNAKSIFFVMPGYQTLDIEIKIPAKFQYVCKGSKAGLLRLIYYCFVRKNLAVLNYTQNKYKNQSIIQNNMALLINCVSIRWEKQLGIYLGLNPQYSSIFENIDIPTFSYRTFCFRTTAFEYTTCGMAGIYFTVSNKIFHFIENSILENLLGKWVIIKTAGKLCNNVYLGILFYIECNYIFLSTKLVWTRSSYAEFGSLKRDLQIVEINRTGNYLKCLIPPIYESVSFGLDCDYFNYQHFSPVIRNSIYIQMGFSHSFYTYFIREYLSIKDGVYTIHDRTYFGDLFCSCSTEINMSLIHFQHYHSQIIRSQWLSVVKESFKLKSRVHVNFNSTYENHFNMSDVNLTFYYIIHCKAYEFKNVLSFSPSVTPYQLFISSRINASNNSLKFQYNLVEYYNEEFPIYCLYSFAGIGTFKQNIIVPVKSIPFSISYDKKKILCLTHDKNIIFFWQCKFNGYMFQINLYNVKVKSFYDYFISKSITGPDCDPVHKYNSLCLNFDIIPYDNCYCECIGYIHEKLTFGILRRRFNISKHIPSYNLELTFPILIWNQTQTCNSTPVLECPNGSCYQFSCMFNNKYVVLGKDPPPLGFYKNYEKFIVINNTMIYAVDKLNTSVSCKCALIFYSQTLAEVGFEIMGSNSLKFEIIPEEPKMGTTVACNSSLHDFYILWFCGYQNEYVEVRELSNSSDFYVYLSNHISLSGNDLVIETFRNTLDIKCYCEFHFTKHNIPKEKLFFNLPKSDVLSWNCHPQCDKDKCHYNYQISKNFIVLCDFDLFDKVMQGHLEFNLYTNPEKLILMYYYVVKASQNNKIPLWQFDETGCATAFLKLSFQSPYMLLFNLSFNMVLYRNSSKNQLMNNTNTIYPTVMIYREQGFKCIINQNQHTRDLLYFYFILNVSYINYFYVKNMTLHIQDKINTFKKYFSFICSIHLYNKENTNQQWCYFYLFGYTLNMAYTNFYLFFNSSHNDEFYLHPFTEITYTIQFNYPYTFQNYTAVINPDCAVRNEHTFDKSTLSFSFTLKAAKPYIGFLQLGFLFKPNNMFLPVFTFWKSITYYGKSVSLQIDPQTVDSQSIVCLSKVINRIFLFQWFCKTALGLVNVKDVPRINKLPLNERQILQRLDVSEDAYDQLKVDVIVESADIYCYCFAENFINFRHENYINDTTGRIYHFKKQRLYVNKIISSIFVYMILTMIIFELGLKFTFLILSQMQVSSYMIAINRERMLAMLKVISLKPFTKTFFPHFSYDILLKHNLVAFAAIMVLHEYRFDRDMLQRKGIENLTMVDKSRLVDKGILHPTILLKSRRSLMKRPSIKVTEELQDVINKYRTSILRDGTRKEIINVKQIMNENKLLKHMNSRRESYEVPYRRHSILERLMPDPMTGRPYTLQNKLSQMSLGGLSEETTVINNKGPIIKQTSPKSLIKQTSPKSPIKQTSPKSIFKQSSPKSNSKKTSPKSAFKQSKIIPVLKKSNSKKNTDDSVSSSPTSQRNFTDSILSSPMFSPDTKKTHTKKTMKFTRPNTYDMLTYVPIKHLSRQNHSENIIYEPPRRLFSRASSNRPSSVDSSFAQYRSSVFPRLFNTRSSKAVDDETTFSRLLEPTSSQLRYFSTKKPAPQRKFLETTVSTLDYVPPTDFIEQRRKKMEKLEKRHREAVEKKKRSDTEDEIRKRHFGSMFDSQLQTKKSIPLKFFGSSIFRSSQIFRTLTDMSSSKSKASRGSPGARSISTPNFSYSPANEETDVSEKIMSYLAFKDSYE